MPYVDGRGWQYRRLGRRRVLAVGTAGGAAFAIACSGGNNNAGNKPSAAASSTAESAAARSATAGATTARAAATGTPAAATPKRGGQIQLKAIEGEIINLDPHLNTQTLLRDTGPGMAWSRLLKL
jgi:hypothetical protein